MRGGGTVESFLAWRLAGSSAAIFCISLIFAPSLSASFLERALQTLQHVHRRAQLVGGEMRADAIRPARLSAADLLAQGSALFRQRDELGAAMVGIVDEFGDAALDQPIGDALHVLARQPHLARGGGDGLGLAADRAEPLPARRRH